MFSLSICLYGRQSPDTSILSPCDLELYPNTSPFQTQVWDHLGEAISVIWWTLSAVPFYELHEAVPHRPCCQRLVNELLGRFCHPGRPLCIEKAE